MIFLDLEGKKIILHTRGVYCEYLCLMVIHVCPGWCRYLAPTPSIITFFLHTSNKHYQPSFLSSVRNNQNALDLT
jgi:hypothetical protein